LVFLRQKHECLSKLKRWRKTARLDVKRRGTQRKKRGTQRKKSKSPSVLGVRQSLEKPHAHKTSMGHPKNQILELGLPAERRNQGSI